MIRDNIKSYQNRTGLLNSREADYMACLELRHREFEALLREDEAKWVADKESVKRQNKQNHCQFSEFLTKQKEDLDGYLSTV